MRSDLRSASDIFLVRYVYFQNNIIFFKIISLRFYCADKQLWTLTPKIDHAWSTTYPDARKSLQKMDEKAFSRVQKLLGLADDEDDEVEEEEVVVNEASVPSL